MKPSNNCCEKCEKISIERGDIFCKNDECECHFSRTVVPNPCDGCQRGLAYVEDGFHYSKEGKLVMACTKDRYEGKERKCISCNKNPIRKGAAGQWLLYCEECIKCTCGVQNTKASLHAPSCARSKEKKCNCGGEIIPYQKDDICSKCKKVFYSAPQKQKCGTDGKTMWCYCGKCKQEDYPLPKDFPHISEEAKHKIWNQGNERFFETLRKFSPTKKEVKTERVYEGTIPKNFLDLTVEEKKKVTCLSLDCPERTGGKCRHSDMLPTEQEESAKDFSDLIDKEKEWLNMLVEKAFAAPLDKLAVRHAMFRLYQKGKKDSSSSFQEGYRACAEKYKESDSGLVELARREGAEQERARVEKIIKELISSWGKYLGTAKTILKTVLSKLTSN